MLLAAGLVALLPLTSAQCAGTRNSGFYMVSWNVTGDSVAFQVTALTTGWVAIGFSDDQFMVSCTC